MEGDRGGEHGWFIALVEGDGGGEHGRRDLLLLRSAGTIALGSFPFKFG